MQGGTHCGRHAVARAAFLADPVKDMQQSVRSYTATVYGAVRPRAQAKPPATCRRYAGLSQALGK